MISHLTSYLHASLNNSLKHTQKPKTSVKKETCQDFYDNPKTSLVCFICINGLSIDEMKVRAGNN